MLETALIIAFSCVGIHISFTWKGMIFYKIGKWLQLRLPTYIKKPLFDCPMCMASFWSIMYWIVFNPYDLIMLPIMIVLVCGINTLLSSAIYYFHDEGEDEIDAAEIWYNSEYCKAKKLIEDYMNEDISLAELKTQDEINELVQAQKIVSIFEYNRFKKD